MKALITTDCYKPTVNGVVTSVCNLETELRRLGHEVKYSVRLKIYTVPMTKTYTE